MTVLKEVIARYETDGRIVKCFDIGELVRCKDCKYWKMEKYIGGEGMACQFMPCDGNVNLTEPTDFCSWAERAE